MTKNIKCYCLSNRGNLHCPLTTDRHDLEVTFNYQVHGEAIAEVEIDTAFKCDEKRTKNCKNCPFKDTDMMTVKTVNQSLFEKYSRGEITLHEAARQFHAHGWTNFVDEDYTMREFNRLRGLGQ